MLLIQASTVYHNDTEESKPPRRFETGKACSYWGFTLQLALSTTCICFNSISAFHMKRCRSSSKVKHTSSCSVLAADRLAPGALDCTVDPHMRATSKPSLRGGTGSGEGETGRGVGPGHRSLRKRGWILSGVGCWLFPEAVASWSTGHTPGCIEEVKSERGSSRCLVCCLDFSNYWPLCFKLCSPAFQGLSLAVLWQHCDLNPGSFSKSRRVCCIYN